MENMFARGWCEWFRSLLETNRTLLVIHVDGLLLNSDVTSEQWRGLNETKPNPCNQFQQPRLRTPDDLYVGQPLRDWSMGLKKMQPALCVQQLDPKSNREFEKLKMLFQGHSMFLSPHRFAVSISVKLQFGRGDNNTPCKINVSK